jgi:hypothetical protein
VNYKASINEIGGNEQRRTAIQASTNLLEVKVNETLEVNATIGELAERALLVLLISHLAVSVSHEREVVSDVRQASLENRQTQRTREEDEDDDK